jgi:hypothetical protein
VRRPLHDLVARFAPVGFLAGAFILELLPVLRIAASIARWEYMAAGIAADLSAIFVTFDLGGSRTGIRTTGMATDTMAG